jgi:esterase/lipase
MFIRSFYILFISFFVFKIGLLDVKAQSFISKLKVPANPYFKYSWVHEGDSITYYLSEFVRQKPQSLIIFIQGSGSHSLFKEVGNSIIPQYGHITIPYLTQDNSRVLIVEKPGIDYLETPRGVRNKDFDEKFSLETWSNRIVLVVGQVIETENIDRRSILVIGHSEGGIVASRVARTLKASHLSLLAGEGPTQLFSLYTLTKSGEFFKDKAETINERLEYLRNQIALINKEPKSTKKFFLGFTYLRWSSFLSSSVMEELSEYTGKVKILQGEDDINVAPQSAIVLYTSLLSKNKEVEFDLIEGADHSFYSKSNSELKGWQQVLTDTISWFNN